MSSITIDPTLPVRELISRYAVARSVLASYGLDTCCGGEHPLARACAAKGVPLPRVLAHLESAQRFAESTSLVPPTMPIRELRRRFPATIPVLRRYGLGDCGGEEGPDEPLAWFATVHRLPLDEFLRDVREAATREISSAPPAANAGSSLPFAPHFILGSLFLTLTLGATTGMVNLLRIAAGGDVPISHRQIHGHTQVLGFAALFLMGIAFHALPRILGIGGERSRAAKPAFWLLFVGVVLRNIGQPLNVDAAGRLLSLASAAMEGIAGFLFARFVFEALSRARSGKYGPADPLLRFVRAGTVYLLIALGWNAAQAIWLSGHLEAALPVSLTEPFYFVSLYGFLLAWVYGFGNRVVSLFLGVGPARKGSPEAAFFLQAGGVALFLASAVPDLLPYRSLLLRDAGLAAVSLSALAFLAGHGFLWRRSKLPALRAPGHPALAIRAAFGCLGLWATLELAAVILSRATSLPAQNLWWSDAARHVFTVGFLTLLIVGMSLRILPVFSGKPLWSPRLALATYGLLLAGVSLRLLQYPGAFWPAFYEAGSFMGIPVVLALLLFTFNLFRTMRGSVRPPRSPAARAFLRRFPCVRPPIQFAIGSFRSTIPLPMSHTAGEAIHIVGAGPAGLAAALTIARRGRPAVVHEQRQDVGSRFHGDLQGIENWTTRDDALDELRASGIDPTFGGHPFREAAFYDPEGREYICRSPTPMFYLVRRGREPNTLDQLLKTQALAAGVQIRFQDPVRRLPQGGIVAGGPRGSDAIVVGYVFETPRADGVFAVLSDRLAPRGYAYLLVSRGRGTVATCIFEDFHREKVYLERTIAFFQKTAGLTMREPVRFGGTGNVLLPSTARHGNILFAGEAAGFQDALWGFGIRIAMLSGHLAAQALLAGAPGDYDRLWRRRLGDLVRVSIVNRYLFDRMQDRGYARLMRSIGRVADTRRWLHRHYAPSLGKRVLLAFARRAARPRRDPPGCTVSGCDCTWCRQHPQAQVRGPSRREARLAPAGGTLL